MIAPSDSDSQADTTQVRALAAPVLQLLYAHYFLTRPTGARVPLVPEWRERLQERSPQLLEELRSHAEPTDGRHHFFSLACELGYWGDMDTDRFLADLPGLPSRLLEQLESGKQADSQPALTEFLQQLEGSGHDWVLLFRRLRDSLVDEWHETGLETVREHCAQFLARYAESDDIIKALPPYHFIRFEKTATSIRSAEGQQELVVVPLYFAAAGGFSFASGGRQFVGFGLSSEAVFEDTRSKVDREAHGIKALADPTRLLLLTLITRYSGFALTVGDLAQYLGVSQPTVSGHLKVLREGGLVEVERRGNKSLYRADIARIRGLLGDLADTLLPN